MFIRPANRGDVPSIATLLHQTFEQDELHEYIWPNRYAHLEDYHQFMSTRLRLRAVGYGEHGFVVVTEETDADWKGQSEIIGYASFIRGGDDEAAHKWRVEPWLNKLERKLLGWEFWYHSKFIDRACDYAHLNNFSTLASWDAYPALKSCWRVGFLCVLPRCQRRGIGSMLMEHGQRVAAEEGLPLTLESSFAGRRLYYKKGFKKVAERRVESYTDIMMVWEPEECKGKWLEEIEGETARVRNEALC